MKPSSSRSSDGRMRRRRSISKTSHRRSSHSGASQMHRSRRPSTGGSRSSQRSENPLSKKLPSFYESEDDPRELLVKKIVQCRTKIDHRQNGSLSSSDVAHYTQVKTETLMEIREFIRSTPGVFTSDVAKEIISLVKANIFRQFNRPLYEAPSWDPEDDNPVLDPSWEYLEIVYDIFLRLVLSSQFNSRVAFDLLTQSFLTRFLELFNTEDSRERDYLKTILHRIYAKFMQLRSFLRTSMRSLLLEYMAFNSHHNGVFEILEIFSSIINGFALPLKEEHVLFLQEVLIPLHRVENIVCFHSQLVTCVRQFIAKDPSLAASTLASLLKYWPRTNSHKELLFLTEVEDILELTPHVHLAEVLPAVFEWVGFCVCSPQFQVAEKALNILDNEYVVAHVEENRAEYYELIIPPLLLNEQNHWHSAVKIMNNKVLTNFRNDAPELVSEVSARQRENADEFKRVRGDREQFWQQVREGARVRLEELLADGVDVKAHGIARVVEGEIVVFDDPRRLLWTDQIEVLEEADVGQRPARRPRVREQRAGRGKGQRRSVRRKSIIPVSGNSAQARSKLESYVPVHRRGDIS
eukprot:gnl/Chilomastix_cuspidata/388.p1 GENE.gnl/Chilomastix_cuspidata/388~~gnl/Chilomastix_cuspidata/388.p1  ORF type:complete len:580 (-),score=304.64 gnl/Chilomastix_cuspidata/388:529-2268(-)